MCFGTFHICDRICENEPNSGINNNFSQVAVLSAYFILSFLHFLDVMKCDLCLAILESMEYQLCFIHY